MTNAEAIAMLKRMQEPEAWEPQINAAAFEALNMAIVALGKDTDAHATDDLISRQAAIDAVNNYLKLSESSRTVQNMTSIQEVLQSVPSARQEHSEGLYSNGYYDGYRAGWEEGQEALSILKKLLSVESDISSYLTDRPCAVCKCHTDDGCSEWECVFERRTDG